nr:MAG TPA: hypothetical protein [Caudoviricetes sp.]
MLPRFAARCFFVSYIVLKSLKNNILRLGNYFVIL